MGNAQEAIQDYKVKVSRTRQVDLAKIVTSNDKAVTMILDHEYLDNSDVHYLTQWHDRFQKWIRNPDEVIWVALLEEYWDNQRSIQYDSPEDEP